MNTKTGTDTSDVEANGAAPQEVESKPSQDDDAPSPRDVHGIKWFLIVVGTLSSIFLYALDNTVVADVTPTLSLYFGDVVKLPWISVG